MSYIRTTTVTRTNQNGKFVHELPETHPVRAMALSLLSAKKASTGFVDRVQSGSNPNVRVFTETWERREDYDAFLNANKQLVVDYKSVVENFHREQGNVMSIVQVIGT